MDESGFPMLLMSNASKRLYPNNNASHFTMQLPSRKQFDEKWVVGVTDFYFPLGFELDDDDSKKSSSEPAVKKTSSNKRKPRESSEKMVSSVLGSQTYPDNYPDKAVTPSMSSLLDNSLDHMNLTPELLTEYTKWQLERRQLLDEIRTLRGASPEKEKFINNLMDTQKVVYEQWQNERIQLISEMTKAKVEKALEIQNSAERINKIVSEHTKLLQEKDAQLQEKDAQLREKEAQLLNQ